MSLFEDILQKRGENFEKGEPLWKLRITNEEYDSLKQTLCEHKDELSNYAMEAALCYAEWWRCDYDGGHPSKELVAQGIGLPCDDEYPGKLFEAAKKGLKKRGVAPICTSKRKEYFRTLLNQGGMPIKYITGENFGNFKRFLEGLVKELSSIGCYNWNANDINIGDLTCSNYLSQTFKNDNIYDVAVQIAHAIIEEDYNLLPYDATDESLRELTETLTNAKREQNKQKRRCPLSLYWKLHIDSEGIGRLYVNMNDVKEISPQFIKGLNVSSCYTFEIRVAGNLIGRYERTDISDEEGVQEATYTRISVGKNNDILWTGEPVVEVKVLCNNNDNIDENGKNTDRIFLTVAGCYPPNFETPQVFQMVDDNLYLMGETANAENNIVIYGDEWQGVNPHKIKIKTNDNDLNLWYEEFVDSIDLKNLTSGETIHITNEFTPFIAEFAGIYLPWLEYSNYKLLNRPPLINVYDENKERVNPKKLQYKAKGEDEWHSLKTNSTLPIGLVDIRVTFPDERFTTETFYYIGNMEFKGYNEKKCSTEIHCFCSSELMVQPVKQNDKDGNCYIEIEPIIDSIDDNPNKWIIKRDENSSKCPSVCYFNIYKNGEMSKKLRLAVCIPFDIFALVDSSDGTLIPSGETISFYNLEHYLIVSNSSGKSVWVTFKIDASQDKKDKVWPPKLKKDAIKGRVSLADYRDLIERMFNLYGEDTREGTVELKINEKVFHVRKYVLNSIVNAERLCVSDKNNKISSELYEGSIFAFPIGENVSTEDMAIELDRINAEENVFKFPEDFVDYNEVIVFSGQKGATKRILPQYHCIEENYPHLDGYLPYDKREASEWKNFLIDEDVNSGWHWQMIRKLFSIFSEYNIPFTTHKGFEAIASDANLLAKFIIAIAMSRSESEKKVLIQEIDRFEQEMLIALHWIPREVWEKNVVNYIDNLPKESVAFWTQKVFEEFKSLLQKLLESTLIGLEEEGKKGEVALKLVSYIFGGEIESGNRLSKEEIQNFKGKIKGCNDNNKDLPTLPEREDYNLQEKYYSTDDITKYYKAMLESAMCAAENACMVENCTNLFSPEKKEHARIANFYRKYSNEVYCDVFLRTIKYINKNPKQ